MLGIWYLGIRRINITNLTPDTDNNEKVQNPFDFSSENGDFVFVVMSKLNLCYKNLLKNENVKNVVNFIIDLFYRIVALCAVNTKPLTYIDAKKAELTKYCRLEQYLDYADINDVKDYIQSVIDENRNILSDKKAEIVIKDGKELMYGEYIKQFPTDKQKILIQILPKIDNEKLTYGDFQKLNQTIEIQKKQGGIGAQLNSEILLADYSEKLDYIDKIQKFIDQKKEDLALISDIYCLEVIDWKTEQLKKEISLSFAEKAKKKCLEDSIEKLKNSRENTEDTELQSKIDKEINRIESELKILKYIESAVEEAIYNSNFGILYPPIEKNIVKLEVDNTDSIVTPISADAYKIKTETGEIVYAVYAGKSEHVTRTYYRTAEGHFYNQNGQEEKPRIMYNSDGTVKSEIQYDSEESGQRILKEVVFVKNERKIPSTITHYQYDANGIFRGKYTEVFDTEGENSGDIVETCYYNLFGNPCKCEKLYVVNGTKYKDIYGYLDGKIKDKPSSTYMFVRNNWKKTTKPSLA